MKRILVAALVYFLALHPALAASRFWVGGTGTWDASSTANWSTTTGGGSGASVPGSSDIPIFDANSGGGTVTVGAAYDPILGGLTLTEFTGTLDFSANNNNPTISGTFTASQTANAATLNCGAGTFTFTGSNSTMTWSNTSNLTASCASATFTWTSTAGFGKSIIISGATKTLGTLNVPAILSGVGSFNVNASGSTIGTVNITAPSLFTVQGGTTLNITNAFNWNGGSFATPIFVQSSSNVSAATISTASGSAVLNYGSVQSTTFSGGATFTANNAIGIGTSGITVNAPSAGGGSQGIIGGGL